MLSDGSHSPVPVGKSKVHAAQRESGQAVGCPSPQGPEKKEFSCIFSSRDADTFPEIGGRRRLRMELLVEEKDKQEFSILLKKRGTPSSQARGTIWKRK